MFTLDRGSHTSLESGGSFYLDGLVQDCSSSSSLAMELLQSCTKQSFYVSLFQTSFKRPLGCHFFFNQSTPGGECRALTYD